MIAVNETDHSAKFRNYGLTWVAYFDRASMSKTATPTKWRLFMFNNTPRLFLSENIENGAVRFIVRGQEYSNLDAAKNMAR